MHTAQASLFRRTSDIRYREDRRGNEDVAYILGRHGGMVLYNVQAHDGQQIKHLYLSDRAFDERWS